MKFFTDVKTLTRNTSAMPITIEEVKSYSKYFRKGDPLDTTQDVFIQNTINSVIDNWEAETGYLILDQTFNTSLYNQVNIYQGFKAGITRLNTRSFGEIKYHPHDWNNVDIKQTLSTDIYFFTPEKNTNGAIFQLKEEVCYLNLYSVYNNLELDIVAGYENNDFTNLPQDIKKALIMSASDIVDVDNEICGCEGFYSQEVQRIYNRYTAQTTSFE